MESYETNGEEDPSLLGPDEQPEPVKDAPEDKTDDENAVMDTSRAGGDPPELEASLAPPEPTGKPSGLNYKQTSLQQLFETGVQTRQETFG